MRSSPAQAGNGRRRPVIPPQSIPPRSNAPRPGEPDGNRIRLTLSGDARGKRLDRALADRLPQHSRTVVTAWIRGGRVLVAGRTATPKTRVEGGEAVEIHVPEPTPSHLVPQDLPLTILYEDDALLILDKPCGLTVHPGAGQRDGTLANALAFHLQGLPNLIGADRPGIVHRLDKATSGIMVVARTEAVQRALSAAFADRTVRKTYIACVHRGPEDASGAVEEPIGRARNQRTRMAVRQGGRPAYTGWTVERRLPRHALLRCHPRTGRTHQIRVHLQHIGCPIVGDPIYGRHDAPGEALAPRMLLHAFGLGFRHPRTGEDVHFEAPLPQDFQSTLDTLSALEPPRRRR